MHTENAVPDPFTKNQIIAYFWINSLKFYTLYFHYMFKSGAIACHLSAYHLLLFYIKLYKTKRGLEVVSLPHFLHDS